MALQTPFLPRSILFPDFMTLEPLLIVELALLGIGTGFLAGLLGIGGGMLMVPFITLIMSARGVGPDLAVKMAIATSMATIIFTSISSVRAHHKRGAVRWDIVKRLAPGIVLGSLVSSLGVFALLKGSGFHGLMDHARRVAGWRTQAVALVGTKPAAGPVDGVRQTDGANDVASNAPTTAATVGASSSEWIAVSRVCEISAIVATGKRTVEQAAALFGLEPQRVETLMTSLKHWLPEVAQPGKRATDDATKGLVALALSSETSMALQRAEAAARARARHDPVGLRSDLEFLIACYDRRDRDFHVRDADSLRRLVRALEKGISRAGQ